jgi:hypothetical protein
MHPGPSGMAMDRTRLEGGNGFNFLVKSNEKAGSKMQIANSILVPLGFMALALISCSEVSITLPIPSPFTLQTRAGTYTYQEQPGETKTKTGTVFVIVPRVSNKVPNIEVGVSITGPSGWNADKELKYSVPAGSDWTMLPVIDAPPISGAYQVKASFKKSVGSFEIVEQKVELVDATQSAEIASAMTISNASRAGATGQWNSISNAGSYIARLHDATQNVGMSDSVFVRDARAIVPGSGDRPVHLENKNINLFVMTSVNFDATVRDPELPVQLQVSDSAAFVNLEGNGLSALGLKSFRAGFGLPIIKR